MKRIIYISELNDFLTNNPEIYIQELLPECILTELYYYQRFQYKLL
jgi:hypothetical protein